VAAADPLTRVRRATARRSRSETDWRASIAAAIAAGKSQREVARAAGVSHTRVQQILRGE